MKTTSVRCYIEEYQVAPDQLGARLREKTTGRKVDLGLSNASDRQAFLRFLASAHSMRDTMPEVFDVQGTSDAVEVSGAVDFDSPEELRFLYNDQLQYVFI